MFRSLLKVQHGMGSVSKRKFGRHGPEEHIWTDTAPLCDSFIDGALILTCRAITSGRTRYALVVPVAGSRFTDEGNIRIWNDEYASFVVMPLFDAPWR